MLNHKSWQKLLLIYRRDSTIVILSTVLISLLLGLLFPRAPHAPLGAGHFFFLTPLFSHLNKLLDRVFRKQRLSL